MTTEAEYIILSQAMCVLLPTRCLVAKIVDAINSGGVPNTRVVSKVFEDNNTPMHCMT